MLLFWFLAALLTVATVIAVVRPLLRPVGGGAPEARAGADTAVYRDQLAEIEVDKARGLINEAEAEAARVEIARRLLASAGHDDVSPSGSDTLEIPRNGVRPPGSDAQTAERLFTIVAAAVPIVALALYLALGSPGIPGHPLAERLAKAPAANAEVDELIARVEARLRSNPEDGQGWDVVAPVYLRIERYADAAEAFRRALAILGETPRRLSGLAESTVLANDGIVTETARKAYQRLLELEPDRMDARFGLAMALEQDGDLDAAEAAYIKVAENAPPQAPWRIFINQRLEAIADKRGAGGSVPRPEAGAADAVAGLPEPQRREAILRMVEGLAARLEANGRDLEGWQRLMRSWSVLGDKDKAQAAFAAARKALAGDDKAISEIDALAKSLGLRT